MKQNSIPNQQAVGTPKSSSMAEGQQGFHLHTSGFETTEPFFEVPGSQTGGYTTESSPLRSFKNVLKIMGLSF